MDPMIMRMMGAIERRDAACAQFADEFAAERFDAALLFAKSASYHQSQLEAMADRAGEGS